jgi:hypothetical protein
MRTFLLAFVTLAGSFGLANAQQVPAGYPAAYVELLEKAKTEGRVVIYSNMSATQWRPFINLAKTTFLGFRLRPQTVATICGKSTTPKAVRQRIQPTSC